jgi:hypothetical protein
MVLRIFLRVIAQRLQSNSPGAAQVDRAALHIGALAFIHRFGSSLNGHVHFHVCVVDGVFEEVPGEGDADVHASPPGIVFHLASAIDETAVARLFLWSACGSSFAVCLGSRGRDSVLESRAVDRQTFTGELGSVAVTHAFDALDEIVPVLEVALLALVKDFGGNSRANALDTIKFSRGGLVHVNSGECNGCVQHGHNGQNLFQHMRVLQVWNGWESRHQ